MLVTCSFDIMIFDIMSFTNWRKMVYDRINIFFKFVAVQLAFFAITKYTFKLLVPKLLPCDLALVYKGLRLLTCDFDHIT